MAQHQQALQLVVLELLAELHEGPALQVHELVLSVRRALAGVQGLLASEGRVELDEMALELGRRHIVVVLQNPSWGELWRRRCCNKAVVLAPTHGPLSVEGVSQMVYILPERLLALVRPAFDLVLRRIRSLKRCVEA